MRRPTDRSKGLARQSFGPTGQFPPYCPGTSLIYLMCTYDRAAARRLVPPELDITEDCMGALVIQVTEAKGDRPEHSQFYLVVEVEGHDSPDGTPGHFEAGIFISPHFHLSYRETYNTRAEPGEVVLYRSRSSLSGVVTNDRGTVLECRIDENGEEDRLAGFINFLTCGAEGGLLTFTVATDGQKTQAALRQFSFGPAAPQWLIDMRPEVQFAWSYKNLTFQVPDPRRLGAAASEVDAHLADWSLLTTFSRFGRAALVMDGGGTVLQTNPAADALDGLSLLPGQKLRPGLPGERAALAAALLRATGKSGAERTSEPIALTRHSNLPPLVARVLPVALRRDCALVTLADPMLAGAEPMEPLRRLGLTAWEAGIAQRVGQGLAPRLVADEMGLTIATIRSAMKTIYSKLSINRQAELVRLVTLLGTI